MKLISNVNCGEYTEIEIEEKFLFFKWRTKYRKYGPTILEFKEPNNYLEVGWHTKVKIYGLFNIPPKILKIETFKN
jgi:hypothetical protein